MTKKKFPIGKWILGLFLFYTVLGFFIIPFTAKYILQKKVSEKIGHPIQVEKIQLNPFTFVLQLNNFHITDPQNMSVVKFNHLLADFEISSLWQDAWQFKTITLDAPFIKAIVRPEGTINLTEMKPAPSETPEKPKKESDKKPKSLIIDSFQMTSGIVDVEDLSKEKPFKHVFQPINITMNNISTRLNDASLLNFNIQTEAGENIVIKSDFGVEPLHLKSDIAITSLKLNTFKTYVENSIPLDLSDGLLNLTGQLTYNSKQTQNETTQFSGNLNIQNLSVKNIDPQDELIGWKQLTFNNIDADLIKQIVKIDTVILDGLRAQSGLNEKGEADIPKPKNQNPTEQLDELAEKSTSKEDTASSENPKSSLNFSINTFELKNSTIAIYDKSITPSFELALSEMNSTLKSITNTPDNVIDFDFTSEVGGTGTIKLSGNIQPFASDTNLEMILKLDNYEMISLTPYTGKMIGYEIDKGKLNIGMDYKIAKNDFVGDHNIFLDKLTLGQKTNSKDAVKAPIKLGLSLLENRKQEIKIDLPVKGDLSDPKFKFTHLIGKSLLNLFTKVVASPFSILSGVVGGNGNDLNQITFQSGKSELSAAEKKKLESLVKALDDRPKLNLTITGNVDPKKDLWSLKETVFNQEFEPLMEGRNEEESYKILKKMFKKQIGSKEFSLKVEKFEQAKGPINDNLKTFYEDIQNDIIKHQTIPSSQLESLAQDRGTAIQTHLVNDLALSKDRLFVQAAKADAKAKDNTVAITLSVSAK